MYRMINLGLREAQAFTSFNVLIQCWTFQFTDTNPFSLKLQAVAASANT